VFLVSATHLPEARVQGVSAACGDKVSTKTKFRHWKSLRRFDTLNWSDRTRPDYESLSAMAQFSICMTQQHALKEIEAMDTPDAHVTFMREQWSAFAAFAWEKYSTEGRGAIVIDLRRASKDGPGITVPTYYVAEGSEGLEKRGGWPTNEVAVAIRDYDPEQDVIFIFLRLDGDAYHYNASDELTPRQAFESKTRRGARLS
jgi:hypothetical protein